MGVDAGAGTTTTVEPTFPWRGAPNFVGGQDLEDVSNPSLRARMYGLMFGNDADLEVSLESRQAASL